MPVNITGAKYNARFLQSVGTTSITTTQTAFVQADFGATQRMVSLHSITGAFKGIAWVRQWVSGTQLQLENQFVDPITGLYATQVVGDQVFVSKNSSESAATGFAVSIPNNTVTVTDNILMGTAGQQNSVCFYDEHMQFTLTNGFTFNGGVSVFGKLLSYDGVSKESFVWSRECTVRPNESYPAGGGTPAFNIWGTGGTSAHMFFFGGALGTPMRRSFFIGAQSTNATNASFAFYGSRMYYACSSPSNGANWASNADRHLLYKTIHEADYSNANLIVWGNGAFQGEFLSFPQSGAGSPLGVFRASSAVTFGASANNRTIVADVGTGAFIDDLNNGSYTFINTITPSVSITRFAGGNVPITFQFSDDYTNLRLRSTMVIQRGDGTFVTSVVNTASTIFTPIVTQAIYSATGNGVATPTNFFTTFNYTIKCYGFNVVNGTHSPYTYSLGTAGSGTDLKLGGLINQLADSNVTLTETQALALSSKFSINSATKVITVSANATYDELYDYVIAWNCSSAANAVLPNLSQYLITANGTDLTAFATWSLVVNTGVTLSNGTKFSKIKFDTITINGTGAITSIYQTTVGTSTIWEFGSTGEPIIAGTSLAIYDGSGVTKYFNAVTTDGVYRYYIAPQSTGVTYTYAIERYGYKREEGTFPSNAGGILFYVPSYGEDVGITETTRATVQAYTTLDDTAKIYDATANFRLSETGIKLGQLVARDGTYLDFGTFNVLFKDDASAIIGVASGTITYKALVINESTKYNAMKATPPKTILANDTEQINVLIEDANGDSKLEVLGGDNLGYELWKIPTSTATDDYATGTLLDTLTTNTEVFRFIGISGFDIVGRDVSSGVRRRSSMLKGSYTQAFYVGNQIQLATDAPQLIENNEKLDELILKIDTDLDVKVSTRLASLDYVAPHNTEIDAIKAVTDTLTNYDDTTTQTKLDAIKTKVDTLNNTDLTGIATSTNVTDAKDEIIAELANIDVDLTGVALEATSQQLITKVDAIQNTVDNIDVDFTPVLNAVDALPTLSEIEASTVLANKTDVETAKDEIITELGNIDVDLTGIATTNDVVNAANGLFTEIQSVDENVWANQPERLKNVATVQSTGDQIQAFKS